MKIGILGSGDVGKAMAKGFVAEGHEVWLATRQPDGEKAPGLKADVSGATITDFATAAKEAEVAVLCVHSSALEDAVELAGEENLVGKVVIDTTNVIQQEGDALIYAAGGTSAGEQVQEWLPDSKVVKAFNTVGAAMMYKPELKHTPTMFIAGDDPDAKQTVRDICVMFGWDPLDAGGIIASRSLEPMALVWINNAMHGGGPDHAFKML